MKEMCENIEQLETHDPKQFLQQLKKFGPPKKKSVPLEVYTEDGSVSSDHDIVITRWKEDFQKLYNNFEKRRSKEL